MSDPFLEGRLTRLAEGYQWLHQLIGAIREADQGRHLVAGQEAFRYEPWDQPLDLTAHAMDYDIINVHPLPGTTLAGQTYQLGRFMSGDLELGAVRDFCRAAARSGKPVNLDEDNTATQYTDHYGWTIHRKRAWIAVLSGCHYDMIDFTVRPGMPVGSPAATADLRTWTSFLGLACERWDVAAGDPGSEISQQDGNAVLVTLRTGRPATWLTYLADPTEGIRRRPAAEPVQCTLELPSEARTVHGWAPASGARVGSWTVPAGGRLRLSFVEDLLLEIVG